MLVLEIAAWHVTTAAATVTSPGANYTEQIDGPTGTHVTHLAVASRAMTGLSSATEDPGQYTDNVTPNGSVAMTIAVPYIPTPSLSTLSPSGAVAGDAAFTLTVNGSGFLSSSTVQWNGSNRTTTFVNSTQLTAAILAADIDTATTPASVTVQHFSVTSNTLSFTITPPSLSSLSPPLAFQGGSLFTLTVNGSDFLSGSVVQWKARIARPRLLARLNSPPRSRRQTLLLQAPLRSRCETKV